MASLGVFGPKCPCHLIKFSSTPDWKGLPLCSSSSPSSMEFPPEGYRRGVGICLFNSSGKVVSLRRLLLSLSSCFLLMISLYPINLLQIFAASRLNRPGIWEMPQGGINEDEDLKTAVKRELIEETEVVSAEIITELPYWLSYDFSPEVSIRLSKHWGVRYKGQTHKWFLMKFTGKDEEINLLGDGTERQEFGEWSWMSIEQILNQASKSRKPVYEQVMKEFSKFIFGNEDDDISLKRSETQLVS